MNVNSFQKLLSNAKLIRFTAAIAIFCAIFFIAAFVTNRSDSELTSKRLNIAVRAIGHELLLQSGDSTSIVSPVIEKSNQVFVLEFENELKFQPDTLVAIAQRTFEKTGISKYTVTVYECLRPTIVYGFEVNPPNNSISPCNGRTQPKDCYTIEIAFGELPSATGINPTLALGISGILAVFAFALISSNLGSGRSEQASQQQTVSSNERNQVPFTIGRFEFDTKFQRLKIHDETISLTDKEYRILSLLHRNMGQLTPREELIQEVWTDDGVITGRSLDMFISKLRKKLGADPDLRIATIHGKGYILENVNELLS
jgi:DNA-binding winged helix-turn-helix (wHTH) protein